MFSFLGTQLPMFALLIYILMSVELTAEVLTTFSIVLITALVGSASTVIALIAYAEPVNAISKAMHDFTVHDHLPNLPEGYSDEIGELMANTQGALKKLHIFRVRAGPAALDIIHAKLIEAARNA